MKNYFKMTATAFLGGAIALGGYIFFVQKPQVIVEKQKEPSLSMVKASYQPEIINTVSAPTDFTDAAEKSVHAVVHVKNTEIKNVASPYDLFFGRGGRKLHKVGTGSGVIISADGYIVTNNHVIDGASKLEITLNDTKVFPAKLIGADPSNDIALLKIETDEELPYMTFGNSDNAKIGEWVLAVGNPFNLNSTVTAGIISAKGRDLEGNVNIESFIQTDAAVNPGNSGGALVNTRGELIGINTAISSQTGSYIGYSFAVPSNIAKKIIDDLMEYGDVQEALIGIQRSTEDLKIEGVRIKKITDGGGAQKAGLEAGDIIKKINNVKITKFSDLRGQLLAKRPGEQIVVVVDRDDELIEKVVTLGKKDFVNIDSLGLILKDLPKEELKNHKLKTGVKIIKNVNRVLLYYGVKDGFIITKINKEAVKDIFDAKQKLLYGSNSNQPLYIEVLNLKGQKERYVFNQ